MVKAARTDSLAERVDQLADVYGEVLLGLYDELTDQRERTEAVAARAEAVLAEARRLTDDMAAVASEARAVEQQVAGLSATTGVAAAPAEATEGERRQLLARLDALEASAAELERSVRERTDSSVTRAEALTEGLGSELRAHVQQSIGDVRTEVQQSIGELRAHVREVVDAVTRETHAAAERASSAAAAGAASQPAAPATEQLLAQLRGEIERRTANVGEAAERANTLATQLDETLRAAREQLHDAQHDRAAAESALRESKAELDAAKRAIDMGDFAFALDRLHRTERLLWGTAAVAVVAILLALWALLS
jgi:chromosome segregation ATPase